MKTSVALFVFLLSVACAFVTPAHADFYVVPVRPGVGVAISNVPCVISDSGFYYFSRDLHFAQTTGAAVTIDADDVTLDLMGFTLSGPGSSSGDSRGILIERQANVEVRNGSVTDFGEHGILGDGSDGYWSNRIIGVRSVRNGGTGIWMNGKGSVIKNCTASYNGTNGMFSGDYASFLDNTAVYNGHYGINLSGHSLLDRNIAKSNNQSLGGYTNIESCANCTFGVNEY